MTTIGSVKDYEGLPKFFAGAFDFVLVRRGTSKEPPVPISIPSDGKDEISRENDNRGTIFAPILLPNSNGRNQNYRNSAYAFAVDNEKVRVEIVGIVTNKITIHVEFSKTFVIYI